MKKQINHSIVRGACLLLALSWATSPVFGQEESLFETPTGLTEEVMVTGDSGVEVMAIEQAIEQESVAAVEYVDYAVSPAETVLAPETRIEDGEQKITITLDGVSLEDTLRMFAQTARANIIAAPNMLTGLYVSVSLNDVDWIPALRSILEIHNFTLAERTPGSGVFTVQRRGADAPEPTSVKTFFLDYTTSSELHEPVQKMLTPGKNDISALQFNSRNALVVRSTESNMSELETLIGELDRPAKQILIEVKILELNDKVAKEVGVKWDFLKNLNVGSFGYEFSRNYTDRRNESYSEFDLNGREQQTSSLDQDAGSSRIFSDQNNPLPISTFQRQVSSEASVSDRGESSSGFDYNSTYDVLREVVSGNSLNLIIDPDVFSIVISALEETDGVSVVSNPKIITTSGSTGAVFKVVDREPVLSEKVTFVDAGNGNIIPQTEVENNEIEVGIKLSVNATVKTDDFIEASINPVLDRIFGYVEGSDGNFFPRITSREISTLFTLRSGQTVAIGGLTQTEGVKDREEVPFLGKIPVIGRLFSHDKTSEDKSETIIFVTLTTVDPATIKTNDAIPEDARLVFKRLLSDKTSLEKFKEEMATIQNPPATSSGEEEKEGRARTSRKRLGPR